MNDNLDQATRSRMMGSIGGKDTKPELLVRSALHAEGFRYRKHDSRLPGKPDIHLPRYSAVIEIRGCFWHVHGCDYFSWPRTRQEFWHDKLNSNVERDIRNVAKLESMGFRILEIWECCLRDRTENEILEVVQAAADWIKNGESSETLGPRRRMPPLS